MTLPVSSYEELLETVRSLNQETRQLQRQLNTPLLTTQTVSIARQSRLPVRSSSSSRSSRVSPSPSTNHIRSLSNPPRNRWSVTTKNDNDHVKNNNNNHISDNFSYGKIDFNDGQNNNVIVSKHSLSNSQYQYSLPFNVEDNRRANNWSGTQSFYDNKHSAKHSYNNNNSSLRMINEDQRMDKEKRAMAEDKEEDEAKISPDDCLPTPPGILADKKFNMWHSVGPTNMSSHSLLQSQNSSLDCENGLSMRSNSQQQLGAKVEIVYNLLSLLENNNSIQSSYQSVSVLLAMSKSSDCCAAMRQTGCVPLLVQIVHDMNADIVVRHNASQALKNIVTFNQDENQGCRESRVYKLLEIMREYCDTPVVVLKQLDISKHPITAIAAFMKLSFDSQHRFAMCVLGAIYTVTRLIQVDHEVHGSEPDLEPNSECVTLRRYAGMALTNLTFGDANTKTLLCSFKQFLKVLILQLRIQCEDLRQVTASVLRNISWRADLQSKQILHDVGAVKALMEASMNAIKETTMKSFLSALWNISAHSPENKEEICKVEGAIEFLIKTLSGTGPFKSVTIIENTGGILKNISCVMASHEEYRDILRRHNVFEMLMQQLQSPSLTIVSNACETIWNLSARNIRDQTTMINLGIVPMLRSLIHSKHKMIATGSSAALNNLMNAMPAYNAIQDIKHNDTTIESTLINSKSTHLNNFTEKIKINTNKFDDDGLKSAIDSNLTNSSPPYNCNKLNDNNLVTEIGNEILKSSSIIDCHVVSIHQTKEDISYDEKDKKSSNGYAETSLDEATNYSLLCEDDDNGEKALTGDTTQTYCTEGTPYNFSNAASYTDLRKCGIEDKSRNESGAEPSEQSTNVLNSGSETPDGGQPKDEQKDGGDVKMVTFETPLMFSRSSSIASLGSCEPQEGYIGSSAVSECSRVTSGLVTPSEIPDSPTPTVPPSPPCFKSENIFEDSVTIFKEEKMPEKGSECTSLSSLTIDDDLPGVKLQYIQSETVLSSLNEENTPMNISKKNGSSSIDKISKSFQLHQIGFLESPTTSFPYLQNKNPGFIPHAKSRLPVMVQNNSQIVDRCPESTLSSNKIVETEADEIIGFYTEGTPANISTATSHSDLSMIAPSEDGSETNVILRQSIKMVGKRRLYQTPSKPVGNLNLQFNQTSTVPNSVNISRSSVMDSPSTESHISNSVNSSEIEDPLTVINNRMSTDSIGSEFLLDDSIKCDNRMPQSHSLHDVHTLNSEPMSEDDDDDDDNNILLNQCINAGIEKITTLKITDEELPEDNQQKLLNQCIPKGLNISAKSKSQMPVKRTKKQDSDLTDEEQQELLESCISAGIRNSKKSLKTKSDDLSDSEQVALLNECIAAGMKNLQKSKSKETHNISDLNDEDLLNNCINQGIKNIERGSVRIKREIPVLNKYKKSFMPKSESEISESTSTITPGDVNGIIHKRDESDESTWKDDETLTFSTLTSSYQSANAGENAKQKLIKLEKGEIGIISSLDFEDTPLDAIKPPLDMDSLLSMTTSVQSNCGLDKKKTSNERNDSLGSCINIENVNPPSYMDEVTDFEMENSITSISSIRSEIVDQSNVAQYYTAVDDLTLVDDLLSSEMSSDPNHSSPAQIRRRLTPKQKRNMKKERYNTYTITSDDSRENSMEPEVIRPSTLNESDSHSSEDAVKKMSPKEKFQIKRSCEKDRFRTRTLADLDLTHIVQSRSKEKDFTLTEYTKNGVDESTTSEGTDGYSSDDNDLNNIPVASARIVKPSEVKAIRGKKKSRGSGIPIVARSSPQPTPAVSKSSQSTPTKKPTPLKRQGTFVKEESRIPTPGSSGKKHTSVPNLVKPPTNKQSTNMRTSGVRNSLSNNSLKSSGDQWTGSNSSLPTMGGVAKTNSNTSLNSNISATSSGCSVRASGQKKEVTSKIATLWKKVEDNKKKNVSTKDNRVWISSNNRI